MKKKAQIDSETCIGCTLCTQMCERVFEMRDDGKSHSKKEYLEAAEDEKAEGASEEQIQTAINACPVSCIHWKKD